MADWQDEPCEVCGRKVMDELACPDRISDGDIICVDCCGYISVDPDDADVHCPIDHSEFYYLWEWLAELYSANPEDPERWPDDDAVMDQMSTGERELVEELGGPIAYLKDRHGMDIWDMRRPIPPDPYQMVINRRAV